MTEEQLHKQVCTYIKTQYPNVLFNTDSSGIKLTIGQAKKLKALRSCNGFPDIAIYESRGGYNGLFIELKRETPYKKYGAIKKSEHLKEQLEMQNKLMCRGYFAQFCWNFDMTKRLIDNYLK